ncbi:MAG: TerB family tellurite resistance protein [Haliea sp.]
MKPLGAAVSEGASRMLNLLGKHEPGAASYLASFSFALARVAYADNVVTDSERLEMRRILHDVAHLEPSEVEFIMELSMMQSRSLGLVDLSPEHGALLAQRKAHFLESLYAIARADGRVSEDEIEEISSIAAEFGIRHQTAPD